MNVAQPLANLDAWLQTMQQPSGYGGPVAHWWQNRLRYTGPGFDWRYEGLLCGYVTLLQKTNQPHLYARLNRAATDLMNAQLTSGSLRASRFEINPGTLGTPHEAAASFGLLSALPYLTNKTRVLKVVKKNLDNLITSLWDPGRGGFNDRPGTFGRVPNKLATFAQALMAYMVTSGDEAYQPYARAALEDVLRYQERAGRFAGAVHQYAPTPGHGDGRFFPFYNARCIPPLRLAARVFAEPHYLDCAHRILEFIQCTAADGSWPQIIYENGKRALWPRWLAGSADILLAFVMLDKPLPKGALERLLASQLGSGGFPTAEGFSAQIHQRRPGPVADYRDALPVVGWNDKVLRLLSLLLEPGSSLPRGCVKDVVRPVTVWGRSAVFRETAQTMTLTSQRGETLYLWEKSAAWARIAHPALEVR